MDADCKGSNIDKLYLGQRNCREENDMFTQRNLKTNRRNHFTTAQESSAVVLAGGNTVAWDSIR